MIPRNYAERLAWKYIARKTYYQVAPAAISQSYLGTIDTVSWKLPSEAILSDAKVQSW